MSVLNLDILKPEAQSVKIGGYEIDTSFIPVGITFEMDDLFRRMQKLDMSKIADGGDESKRAIDLAIDLCGIFCQVQAKELTPEWFRINANNSQVVELVSILKATLIDSLKGVHRHPKNAKATETKT